MTEFTDYLRFRAYARRFASGIASIGFLEEGTAKGFITGPGGAPITLEDAVPELKIRNLCAEVPGALVDELDEVLRELQMSKRDFIEYALRDAIAIARWTLADVGGPDHEEA